VELARRRPVLAVSVDPAHALGAVLEAELGDDARAVPDTAGLVARELDAAHAFEERRAGWKRRVDEAFADRLGSGLDARLDREALARLVDLAPPGIDALGGLLALVDELALAPGPGEGPADASARRLVVLDTPATGHALELLALPEQALAWVHAVLTLLLAQPEELRPHDLARELLAAARSLRALRALLVDPLRTRCLVVTRRDELPRRETVRLAEGLDRLGLAVAAVVVNASSADAGAGCARCRRTRRSEEAGRAALRADLPPPIRRGSVTILAPEASPAPVGPRALAAWSRTWRVEPGSDARASAPA
jgi:anion-transporting  ArsA/GET3 family ATPase